MNFTCFLFCICLALTACGGGDGSDRGATPPSVPASASTSTSGTGSQPMTESIQWDMSVSIVGIDANRDGVRDDIERWIDLSGLPAAQQLALRRAAKAMQAVLAVDHSDAVATRAVAYSYRLARKCATDGLISSSILNALEGYMISTSARAAAYDRYQEILGTSGSATPQAVGCS